MKQCSSCKRTGVTCLFSRVLMKRGLTKRLESTVRTLMILIIRYIQELEDRLASLENAVQIEAHVSGREHSPPVCHAEYDDSDRTSPQVYNRPHARQDEPIKLEACKDAKRSTGRKTHFRVI